MATALFTIERLLEAINAQQLILTANNRQRNQILTAWADWQQAHPEYRLTPVRLQTLNTWQQVLWQAWLKRCPQAQSWRLASPWQLQLLWQKAIDSSPLSAGLLQTEPLTAMAESARSTLALWRVDEETLMASGGDDERHNLRVFSDWLERFNRLMADEGLLTQEQISGKLIDAFSAGQLPREPAITLYGFDDLPPQVQQLLAVSAEVTHPLEPAPAVPPQQKRTRAADTESEIRAAALWAGGVLADNADARIGIIALNLGQQRDRIARIFAEVFEPLLTLPEQPRYAPGLNFSAGTPLADAPAIHTALELLALEIESFDLDRLCNLLCSPFWGTENPAARASLASHLRYLGQQQLDIRELRYQYNRLIERQKLPDEALPELLAAADFGRTRSQQRSPGQWLETLFTLLQARGWPGPRALDSIEYQQLKQWYGLLDEIQGVEQIAGTMDLASLLALLRRSAASTHFQPQTPHSPIQVLGALEGAGLNFTHCWVMGVDHQQWPPAPAANPLLPVSLQRELQMPHASAERELGFAERLTAHYRQLAGEVVFSHAASREDNPLRPSALIADIEPVALETLTRERASAEQDYYQRLCTSAQLQRVDCRRGPPLTTGSAVRGGAQLFKRQAACPFTAFACMRLGAHAPEPPVLGFSPLERGTMLHEALAQLWHKLGTRDALRAMPPDNLTGEIQAACAEAVEKVRQRRPQALLHSYCEIECARLQEQITLWLALEAERPAFRVTAIEQRQQVVFAGLELSLQVDRIDELVSGRQLVIDYKTGNASPASWNLPLLREPQLPLYASIVPGDVAAIAFAIVNVQQQTLTGWGDDSAQGAGVAAPAAENWEAQLANWQDELTRLADEFRAGYAAVDYRDPQAANYDAFLAPLTRIADNPEHWLSLEIAQP